MKAKTSPEAGRSPRLNKLSRAVIPVLIGISAFFAGRVSNTLQKSEKNSDETSLVRDEPSKTESASDTLKVPEEPEETEINKKIQALPETLLGASIKKVIVPGAKKVLVHIKTVHRGKNPSKFELAMIRNSVDPDISNVSAGLLSLLETNVVGMESANTKDIREINEVLPISHEAMHGAFKLHIHLLSQAAHVEGLLATKGKGSPEYQEEKNKLDAMNEQALMVQGLADAGREAMQTGSMQTLIFSNGVQLAATTKGTSVELEKILEGITSEGEMQQKIYEDRENEAVEILKDDKRSENVKIALFGANHDFSNNVPEGYSFVEVTPSTVLLFEVLMLQHQLEALMDSEGEGRRR